MSQVTEQDIYEDYLRIFKDAGVDINTLLVIDLGYLKNIKLHPFYHFRA
jgi:hypothetical protein